VRVEREPRDGSLARRQLRFSDDIKNRLFPAHNNRRESVGTIYVRAGFKAEDDEARRKFTANLVYMEIVGCVT
jgi:hypothetical protein